MFPHFKHSRPLLQASTPEESRPPQLQASTLEEGKLLTIPRSCSSMYIPPTPSLPLLEDKGEGKTDMSISTNSLRLSTSYAITQKYALIVNGNLSYKNFCNSYDLFTPADYKIKSTGPYVLFERKYGEFTQQYVELGIGRYNIAKSKLIFEVFGGLRAYSTDNWSGYDYFVNYYSGFVQANIGRKHKGLEFDEEFDNRGISRGNPKYTILHFSVGIRYSFGGKVRQIIH